MSVDSNPIVGTPDVVTLADGSTITRCERADGSWEESYISATPPDPDPVAVLQAQVATLTDALAKATSFAAVRTAATSAADALPNGGQ